MAQALDVIVDAVGFNAADASKLTALLQSSQESEVEEGDTNAPAAAVYEGPSLLGAESVLKGFYASCRKNMQQPIP